MTDEKPTDEELDAIYGAVILAPGAGDEAHFPGLRAVLEAGIAWERERRAKRRGERPTNPYVVGMHRHTVWGDAFEAGVAWADSAESDELAELREQLRRIEGVSDQDDLIIDGLESENAKLEAELSHLRANSYAAAVEAIRGESPRKAEPLQGYMQHVADWLTGLSQQSAQQAAQGGELTLTTSLELIRELTEQLAAVMRERDELRAELSEDCARTFDNWQQTAAEVRRLTLAGTASEQKAKSAARHENNVRELWRLEKGKVDSLARELAEAKAQRETDAAAITDRDEIIENLNERLEACADELAEAKAYGEERNSECNNLQRFLNLAAEERDSARSELSEAKEELRLLGAIEKRVRGVWAPDHALLIALDAHRAKVSAEKRAGR